MSDSQAGHSSSTNGMTSPPSPSTGSNTTPSVSTLPPEALDLASKLFNFARAGDVASLTQYIQAGIPVNLRNSNGDTFLMLASYHNHPNLVQKLLELNADVNITNDKGQSVLSGAVFKDYTDVVKVLVENAKSSLDIRAGKPDAVQCAAMFKRWECAELMGVLDECKELSVVLNPVGSRDAL